MSNRQMILARLLLCLLLLYHCKSRQPTKGNEAPPEREELVVYPPPEGGFAVAPQAAIPWESVAGCVWPMAMHDAQRTGRAVVRGPQKGKILWKYEANAWVFSSPVLGPDAELYTVTYFCDLIALSLSGARLWTSKIEGKYCSTDPLVDRTGTIYCWADNLERSDTTFVYAVNSDGRIKWRFSHISPEKYFPYSGNISQDGSLIFIVMYNYKNAFLLALHTANGQPAWKSVVLPEAVYAAEKNPAIGPDQNVYLAFGPCLYAFSANGELLWKKEFAQNISCPSIDNAGNLYLSGDRSILSLYPNGAPRWQNIRVAALFPEYCTPGIGPDGSIYIIGFASGGGGKGVAALDNDGREKWFRTLIEMDLSEESPVVDSDGTVYVVGGTYDGDENGVNLFAVNRDGSLRFKMAVTATAEIPDIDTTPAIGMDGVLYVGSDKPGEQIFAIE